MLLSKELDSNMIGNVFEVAAVVGMGTRLSLLALARVLAIDAGETPLDLDGATVHDDHLWLLQPASTFGKHSVHAQILLLFCECQKSVVIFSPGQQRQT